MKTKLTVTMLLILSINGVVVSKSVNHHWHTIDRGGGKSIAGGITLYSSTGQPAIQAMTSGGNSQALVNALAAQSDGGDR